GNINLFGAKAKVHAELANSGFSLEADASFLGANVDLKGSVQTNGTYLLSGKADVNFYVGEALATFTLQGGPSSASLLVDASVDVLGNNVAFHGDIASNGTFTISGHLDAGFYLANGSATLTFSNEGPATTLYIDGHLNVLGSSVEVTGYEDNLGNYRLA